MAKIIGRVLEDSRVPFLYYVGEMRNEKKDKSLQDFHFTKDIKVMVSAQIACSSASANESNLTIPDHGLQMCKLGPGYALRE